MEKLKLLYVDDEKVNLTNFAIALRSRYHIFTAISGAEALKVFEDNDDIAIVVADQRMPGMTGVELLEHIKERNEVVIRIILTAYTEASDIIDAINKGHIYQYIVKPWDETELLHILEKASEKYQLVCENKRLVRELEEDISKRKKLEGILVRRDMALAEVTDMAVNLLLSSDWRGYAEELIARLGTVMAVSRVHIFQHITGGNDDLSVSKQFEWVGEHVPQSLCEPVVDDFSYSEQNLQRWFSSFEIGVLLFGNTVDFPDDETGWLNRFHIKSIVSAPILTGKNCWGFISFEDCSFERGWARPELDALKTTATLLGTAILRQKMEGDIVNQQAQLDHAGRLTALGEMASGIGHEIHQPLSVINLNAENCESYLVKHDPDSFVVEAVGEIRGQVNKIKRLIDNMRRFSRLSPGELKKLCLTQSLENARTFFKEQFRLNSIEFCIEMNRKLPRVKTDAHKFEQIMMNFLSNARYAVNARKEKETDLQKRIVVRLDYKNMTDEEFTRLTFKKDENYSHQVVRIEVIDNGDGMDEATQKRCLEPFFTTKKVGDGTGLGLSVSHGIIQELNFHLEIESQEGAGSVFRLYVPVEKEEQV